MTLVVVNGKVSLAKRLTIRNRRYDMSMTNNEPFINPKAVSIIMQRLDVESEESRVFITAILAHYEAGGKESLIATINDILAHYKQVKNA